MVVTVNRFQDISLRQEYEIVVTLLDGTNRLWEAEAVAVLNIICPQVEYRGEGRPTAAAESAGGNCHAVLGG